jgi:hypothetical protein
MLGRQVRLPGRGAAGTTAAANGSRARRLPWPAVTGTAFGVLALGPGLGWGFILSYDMVFVPRPPISAATLGLDGAAPRAVPSDLAVAVAARAMPAELVQKLILVGIFVLACSGAARLIGTAAARDGRREPPLVARLAAGACYAWNPFVAERLILGQWALLLGYAGLPWAVRVTCRGCGPIRLRALLGALVPAAVGGFAAMSISAIGALPVAAAAGRPGARLRRLGVVFAAIGALSLPWLIPALLAGVHTDPRAVDAFAARADTPFGRLGSLLMLGGAWNAQTVPHGYGGPASAVWLLAVLAALAGYLLLARPARITPGLGIAALLSLAVALAGTTALTRAALSQAISLWPGFAVLRDGQAYLAPLALAEAVGLGALVSWIHACPATGEHPAGSGSRAGGTAPARAVTLLCVFCAAAPVVLLPGLAWGAAGRLHANHYPADWMAARELIDGDPHPGAVLLLPWASYRRYPWNGGEAVLDPWTKLLRRRVIWNDALRVGTQTVAAEIPAARRLTPVISSAVRLTGPLRRAGIRYVIVDAGPALRSPCRAAVSRLPGATVLMASPDLVLYRLTASAVGMAPGDRAPLCPEPAT